MSGQQLLVYADQLSIASARLTSEESIPEASFKLSVAACPEFVP